MNTHTGLLAGAIACTIALPAFAQTAPKPRPLVGGHGDNVTAFVAEYDDSGDGRLDWAEFEAFRRHRFDATDADRGGTVEIEEYVREFAQRRGEALRRQREAQLAQAGTRFAALDTDHDGKVSRAEFDASGRQVFDAGQKTLAALDDGSDTALRARGRNTLAPTSHTAEGFLALYDTNQDGQVQQAEFDAHRDAQFARTDADGDGLLDESEYRAEFAARLDARLVELEALPDTQTRVRFNALDADKDGRMTFVEYQVSGKRLFDGADRNRDGIVDAVDAALPPVARAPLPRGNGASGNGTAASGD